VMFTEKLTQFVYTSFRKEKGRCRGLVLEITAAWGSKNYNLKKNGSAIKSNAALCYPEKGKGPVATEKGNYIVPEKKPSLGGERCSIGRAMEKTTSLRAQGGEETR